MKTLLVVAMASLSTMVIAAQPALNGTATLAYHGFENGPGAFLTLNGAPAEFLFKKMKYNRKSEIVNGTCLGNSVQFEIKTGEDYRCINWPVECTDRQTYSCQFVALDAIRGQIAR